MKHFISIKKTGRYTGKIEISYNLKYVALFVITISAIAVLYGTFKLLMWVLPLAWNGICTVGLWCIQNILWVFWIPAGLAILYLLYKNRIALKEIATKDRPGAPKWLYAVGMLLIAVLIAALLFRSCSSNEETETVTATEVTSERVYDQLPNVIKLRCYLDGVDRCLGIKNVGNDKLNLKDIKNSDEKVVEVVDKWCDDINDALNGIKLSDRELVIISVYAMRNGIYGFKNSEVLTNLQAGNEISLLDLYKRDGVKRNLETEAKKYLWVIQNLWDKNLSLEEVFDMPQKSYISIPLLKMYDEEGNITFDENVKEMMEKGSLPSPNQAL